MREFPSLIGKRFGKLTVVEQLPSTARGQRRWLCKCDCGNEVDTPYNWLMYSGMQSCDCQRREHEQSLSTYLTHVNSTSLDMIRSKKVPNDNTTGYRGVYLIKGKYVAKIVFQKKAYYLGVYDNIEEAAQARKEAEDLLFVDYERIRIHLEYMDKNDFKLKEILDVISWFGGTAPEEATKDNAWEVLLKLKR